MTEKALVEPETEKGSDIARAILELGCLPLPSFKKCLNVILYKEKAMREMWSKLWLLNSVVLLLLGLYRPLQADPPTQAAAAAASAAQAARNAASSAQDAANSSTAVTNTVQKGNDAGALYNANQAAKDAADADAAAKSAAALAQQALDLAKQAQAEYDNPKGNPFKAGSLADDASALERKAEDEAKKAADKAAAAADEIRLANQRIENDKEKGTTPLSQGDNDALEKQKKKDSDIKYDNDARKKDDFEIRKKAVDMIDEDKVNIFDQLLKGSQKHPGDGSLLWSPHHGFFVAVVSSNSNSISFPNLNSPLAVPELAFPENQSALLKLELINDNPFPVDVTGVTGLLFGNAVTFNPFVGDQTVPANGSAMITLGTVDFTGSADAFTAADFNIRTGAGHPGLGPDFPTNFDVVTPEPASITLLILGVLGVAIYCWAQRKRSGCAQSTEQCLVG